jgi:hypothetical protein
MKTFIGIDVSLAISAFCVLDEYGHILKEAQVASEPEASSDISGACPSQSKRSASKQDRCHSGCTADWRRLASTRRYWRRGGSRQS